MPLGVFLGDVSRLRSILGSLEPLGVDHRYPIAELVCLRLFDSFENVVASIAYRLACGAKYLNGATPVVLKKVRTIDEARLQMLIHNRKRQKSYLEWSKATYIAESVEHVLEPSDHFTNYVRSNGVEIGRLRIVRNVIAHLNRSTKEDYSTNILLPKYGSDRFLRPGRFLLSQRFGGNSPILEFIDSMEILVKGITRTI